MKSCPECRTEYEDHIVLCLVDGSPLADVAATPAPMARSGASKGGGLVFFVVAGAAVLLLLGIGVGSLFRPEPVAVPEPAIRPAPVEIAPAAPVEPAEPVAPPVIRVGFTSDPQGAALTEQGEVLCTTPCTIEHPEHAPLPRTFVLKSPGYIDTDYTMNNPGIPQLVKLSKPPPKPLPRRRPAPIQPQPAPEPVVGPRPSISLDR